MPCGSINWCEPGCKQGLASPHALTVVVRKEGPQLPTGIGIMALLDMNLGIVHLEGWDCICFWYGETREEQKCQTRLWGGKGTNAPG